MAPSVNKIIIRGGGMASSHVTLSSSGVLSSGAQQGFPGGAFTIQVATKIQDPEAFHSALKRIVRNSLSAYPIVDIEDGGGLPFDLKAWLREHRASL